MGARRREASSQGTCIKNPWTRQWERGLNEGGGDE